MSEVEWFNSEGKGVINNGGAGMSDWPSEEIQADVQTWLGGSEAAEIWQREQEEYKIREAAAAEQRATRRNNRRNLYQALLAQGGMTERVATLHTFDSALMYCHGCEHNDPYDDYPDNIKWPCKTINLLAEEHGLDVEGL